MTMHVTCSSNAICLNALELMSERDTYINHSVVHANEYLAYSLYYEPTLQCIVKACFLTQSILLPGRKPTKHLVSREIMGLILLVP